MGIEQLLDNFVVVVMIDNHSHYTDRNYHYFGRLIEMDERFLTLGGWNDRLVSYGRRATDIGLDTNATDRSDRVYIPTNRIKHLHSINPDVLVRGYIYPLEESVDVDQ